MPEIHHPIRDLFALWLVLFVAGVGWDMGKALSRRARLTVRHWRKGGRNG